MSIWGKLEAKRRVSYAYVFLFPLEGMKEGKSNNNKNMMTIVIHHTINTPAGMFRSPHLCLILILILLHSWERDCEKARDYIFIVIFQRHEKKRNENPFFFFFFKNSFFYSFNSTMWQSNQPPTNSTMVTTTPHGWHAHSSIYLLNSSIPSSRACLVGGHFSD